MAGVSESPYRILAAELGAGWTPTELVSSRGLEHRNPRTEAYLRHDPDREPALTVQLYGSDPDAMARAAEVAVERGARIVDVNMGCPVKKITKNQAGSALMAQPERAVAVVRAMVQRLDGAAPVTVKMRAGWDEQQRNAPELGRRLRDVGAAALSLHARTRMQGYEGRADWGLIGRLREAVPDIPVIANGDIDGPAAAEAVVAQTGCDAVMVGRAALGHPWIFRSLSRVHRGEPAGAGPTAEERVTVILRHLAGCIDHVGDETRALYRFRQHLAWYSRGLRGAPRFRERVMKLEGRTAVEDAVQRFFGSAGMLDPTEAVSYSAAYG
jgi:nifR3 family TIM-barrel protein